MKNEYLIFEQERHTPVTMDVDVCVVGGGAAGVAAAVSAAQCGARVALLERYGFLGGTLTTVSLGSICGIYAVREDALTPIVGGFLNQVVSQLTELNGCGDTVRWLKTASLPYDQFKMKVALDRLTSIHGVQVLLHSLVVGVAKAGDDITHVLLETREGRVAISASQFIDCSGDAELCARAGVELEINLNDLQQPTTMFRMMDVDNAAFAKVDRAALHQNLEMAVNDGMDLPRTAGGVFMERPGLAHLNITKVNINGATPNPLSTRELTKAEQLGREQVLIYEHAFRKYVPGFANAKVLDTGAAIGIRESRRLVGEYVLTKDDVLGSAKFSDGIACCSWPIEDHAAGRATKWVWLEEGEYFQIPFRSLLPKKVSNWLLVAALRQTMQRRPP
jgi:hypothetical protein